MKKTSIWGVGLIALLAVSPALAINGSRATQTEGVPRASASAVTPGATMAAPVQVPAAASLVEGFDDISTIWSYGWYQQNLSFPVGINPVWFQGNPPATGGPFVSHQGADNSYIAVNFNSTAGGTGTISNWLMTPVLEFGGDATLTFWTRKWDVGTDYPDRLEVRLSTNGASINAGSTATSTGDFTTVLLSINPNLVVGEYPRQWAQYTITNADGLPRNGSGRIAFRYFVTSAGPAGTNSDYIGVDTFSYSAGEPQYQVRANVSGLAGDAVGLSLNGAPVQTVTTNGAFTFPDWLEVGSTYSVTVVNQPNSPMQTCEASPASGTVASADVEVAITCTTEQFQVIANVSGLVGDAVGLSLNGGPVQTFSANGAFTFPNQVDDGSAYSVVVASQPHHPKQTCEAIPASGTIASADADVAVTCTTDPYVLNPIGGDGQETPIYASFPQALVVELLDGAGDPVAGAPITFEAPIAGASAWLHDDLAGPDTTLVATTSADGVATVHVIANGEAGCYGVTASHPNAVSTGWELVNIWYASIFSDGFETPPALLHGVGVCTPLANGLPRR